MLVDFNDVTPDGKRVRINDESRANRQQLFVGQRIVVYEADDFEVEVTLEMDILDDKREIWYGVPDWSTKRDLT